MENTAAASTSTSSRIKRSLKESSLVYISLALMGYISLLCAAQIDHSHPNWATALMAAPFAMCLALYLPGAARMKIGNCRLNSFCEGTTVMLLGMATAYLLFRIADPFAPHLGSLYNLFVIVYILLVGDVAVVRFQR